MISCKFVNLHISTIERLFTNFPSNVEVLQILLTTITSLSISHLRNPDLSIGDELSLIELRIVDFALHIAQFPFPLGYLPPLPNTFNRMMEKSNQNMKTNNNKTWWDNVHVTLSKEYIGTFPLSRNFSVKPWTIT